jgi:hypothetical protein
MDRRGFLRLLAGAAAASTTAYFLPPIGGWRSDVIVNPRDSNHVWSNDGFSYGSVVIRKGDFVARRPGEKAIDVWGPDFVFKGSLAGEFTPHGLQIWGVTCGPDLMGRDRRISLA